MLAVQEVGDEQAFEELLSALEGEWQAELSPDADDRGIRVGFLSKLPFEDVERIRAFPAGTDPVRAPGRRHDDEPDGPRRAARPRRAGST